MKSRRLLRLVLFFILGLSISKGYGQKTQILTYYVATSGDSNNPGTIEKPFLRPEDAWNKINKIQGPADITVNIRGGIYHFSRSFILSQIDLDSTRHVTFSNYQNERIQFTGSAKLDNDKFKLVVDSNILIRLPTVARGKIYEFNLKEAGIYNYGKMQQHGYKIIRPAPLELFYNDSLLIVARYPNNGYIPIGKVIDPGTSLRYGAKVSVGAKFVNNDGRIKLWKTARNAWVGGYFSYGYSDDYLKVDTFDFTNHTIRLKHPAIYSVFSTDDTSNEALKNAQKIRGFYVYNLLEEIDIPGEWFLDEESGKLYVWPPDNALNKADIEVSILEDPLVVMSNTCNVTFKGISFEFSRGMGILMEGTKNTVISRCNLDNLGTVGISTSVQLNDKNIKYQAPGGKDKSILPYNVNLLIESCNIFNTGTGGVFLDGGDRKNLNPANNILNNCELYNYSRINRTFCPGVYLNGVNNQVTHCDIHDAPDQAIIFYGNDHTISFNHIRNVVSYVTDAGAVGTGRDIASTGTAINNNFFDNIVSTIDVSTCAVYLDDGSVGIEVDGNVFYRSGTPGTYNFGAVHINGGGGNYFRNNYFIECPQAFSNSQWNDKQWRDFITNSAIAKTYRPDIDINADLYRKKYPYLSAMTDSNKIAPRQNYSFNTLAYKVAVFSTGQSYIHRNILNIQQDPGFANTSKPDFTLLTIPTLFQQTNDWKAVPFKKIGLIRSIKK